VKRPIIDTSWQAAANPSNTPWLPGYRFCMLQPAQKLGRGHGKMRPRQYHVMLGIDRKGLLEFRGGVKPSPRTWDAAQALYARERPGSNGGPA